MKLISQFTRTILLVAICLTPPAMADTKYPALRDSVDPELQKAFDKALTDYFGAEFWELAKAKKVGIAIADVTNPQQPRVAAVNGELMLYAASLPKIAILLGAFVQIERGNLVLDDNLRQEITRMIRKSSNKDATSVLNKVGIAELAQILQSDRYRLYDPKYGGGLWVGRDYGGGTVWKRDPINNISHGASAMQVARWYYLAVTERLVDPKYQTDLAEIMGNPAIKHKFVKGLKDKKDTEIYRKSGTWKNFHADGGVVVHRNNEYIIVGIVEHPKGGEGLAELVILVDDLMEKMQ
ncbi:MAG: serine hydrolase [Desulfobacteraceae bacterium]|nr:serine hydrolase [Desulfobacteraceae bacterium]